jgi:Immunity protein 53
MPIEQTDGLHWLQNFLHRRSNGEWEHTYGIDISSIDNPGWRVKIDLGSLDQEKPLYERTEIERSEGDWIHCWVDSDTASFHGAGGVGNLVEIIDAFRAFVGE